MHAGNSSSLVSSDADKPDGCTANVPRPLLPCSLVETDKHATAFVATFYRSLNFLRPFSADSS